MSDDIHDDESDWSEYESGPFCRHWSDPWECENVCKCGHTCPEHSSCDNSCNVEGCDCQEWAES